MWLSQLVKNYIELPCEAEVDVTGLSLNSLSISTGDVFVAVAGATTDGAAYIDEAIARGAIAILCDGKNAGVSYLKGVPLVSIPRLKMHLASLAKHFYPLDLPQLAIFSVTGTNGKSSVAYLLMQALDKLQKKTAMIGTIGNGFLDQLETSYLTTPDVISLRRSITDYVRQGAKSIAMEVSSHALDQGRVDNLPICTAIFTNLSRDHLDYHDNMDAYGEAKLKLFIHKHVRHIVVNLDQPFSRKIIQACSDEKSLITYSMDSQIGADVSFLARDGNHLSINIAGDIVQVTSRLIGDFNIENLLAVVASLYANGFDSKAIAAAVSALSPVPGRLQHIESLSGSKCVIDYAHTPDALEKALKACRSICEGKLICVFGCGGNRDRGKRKEMGEVANRLADSIILTSDNPRNEDPRVIIQDILLGVHHSEKVLVIEERYQAIKKALCLIDKGDVVLLAGKGHEKYQIIGSERRVFDEQKIVSELLKASESC